MVIAMALARVVQVAVHEIIGVIAVRHGFVAAIRTMLVALLMTATVMCGRAAGGIFRIDGNHVLLDLVAVLMVQVAVVQIVDMALVLDSGVAAFRAVLVRVTFVMACHGVTSSCEDCAGKRSAP
jgi:hypothetical protein